MYFFTLYLRIVNNYKSQSQPIIMTKSERDDAIVSALTKICISLLVRNFLKKDGFIVLEEMLSMLKEVPDADEPYYSRANSALEYLLNDTEKYLITNKAFNEKHYQK